MPVLVLGGLLIHFESKLKYEAYEMVRNDRDFWAAPDTIETLIAGNSRAFRGIDPSLLPKAMNIATPGESFIETAGRLEAILAGEKRNIRRVILPCGTATFKGLDFRRDFFWRQYVDYLEVGRKKGALPRYAGAWLRAHLLPYRHHYGKRWKQFLEGAFGTRDATLSIDKAYGKYVDLPPDEQKRLLQRDRKLILQSGTCDIFAIKCLRAVTNKLLAGKIEVILIDFPLTPDFREAIPAASACRDAVDQIVRDSPAIRRHDFSDLFDDRLDYFSDEQHLNLAGRAAFMQRLIPLLNLPANSN